jgi:hypothetical protein
MSTPIDISSWQWPELVRASKLIQKVITNQVSSMFENEKVLPVDRHHVLIHLVLVTSFSSSPLFLFFFLVI